MARKRTHCCVSPQDAHHFAWRRLASSAIHHNLLTYRVAIRERSFGKCFVDDDLTKVNPSWSFWRKGATLQHWILHGPETIRFNENKILVEDHSLAAAAPPCSP